MYEWLPVCIICFLTFPLNIYPVVDKTNFHSDTYEKIHTQQMPDTNVGILFAHTKQYSHILFLFLFILFFVYIWFSKVPFYGLFFRIFQIFSLKWNPQLRKIFPLCGFYINAQRFVGEENALKLLRRKKLCGIYSLLSHLLNWTNVYIFVFESFSLCCVQTGVGAEIIGGKM